MQAGDLLEHVLPTWSLYPVFLSVAIRTQTWVGGGWCSGWIFAGMEWDVAGMFPGHGNVHEHGWPVCVHLPRSTDCPGDCAPVKGWCNSTEPSPPHTTSTSGGSRCACAVASSFIKGILHGLQWLGSMGFKIKKRPRKKANLRALVFGAYSHSWLWFIFSILVVRDHQKRLLQLQ